MPSSVATEHLPASGSNCHCGESCTCQSARRPHEELEKGKTTRGSSSTTCRDTTSWDLTFISVVTSRVSSPVIVCGAAIAGGRELFTGYAVIVSVKAMGITGIGV